MNYTTKAIIVIVAVLAVAAVISLTVVIVLATKEVVIIDRQLIAIFEQEDNSIEVYDRSNGTQIAGFDNFTEMLHPITGLPKVIQQMEDYYADRNLTDILVIK
jgi:hypothetical protein